MRDTRRDASLFALGAVTVAVILGAAPSVLRSDGIEFPDGTVQTTAAATGPRAYYLTDVDTNTHNGAEAVGACATGFHVAALWEILDPSNLRYASEVGGAAVADDSPFSPRGGAFGWVRTGQPSSGAALAGVSNCQAWTSMDGGHSGSLALLEQDWTSAEGDSGAPKGYLGPWTTSSANCFDPQAVWCVEDY